MTTGSQRYREPLRTTLLRTGAIAVGVGAIIALASHGGFRAWPGATLLALWPALGGHYVEVLFLNEIRPRLPDALAVQTIARLVVWFVAGIALAAAMVATARILHRDQPIRSPSWWLAGLGFIAIELIAHLALQLKTNRSFYNGRG